MKAYSELEVASLENLSSDPALLPNGRFWLNTTEHVFKARINSFTTVFMSRDKAVVGTNGTSSNNIRLHRGAAALLQVVPGNDSTADGTAATTLGQLDARVINYANVAALPAAGQIGRTAFAIAEGALYYDNGSAWVAIAGFGTQTANTIFAGPVSGAAANPTFRALDYRDLPQSGNLLLNADATISERGAYTTATAMSALLDSTNFYFADRHRGLTAGLTTAQVTVQRNSASLPTGFSDGFSLKIAATATNASARIGWQQALERPEYLRGKVLTFRSYVKSNNANARLAILAGVGASAYSSAHTGGGGWEELTTTLTVDSAETSLIPTARIMTSANANVSITSGDFVEVFMPTVYVGSIFPGYVNMFNGNVAAERLACKRYFQKISSRYYLAQMTLSANEVNWFWPFEVEMRGAPTTRFEGTANTDYAAISVAGSTQSGFSFATSEASVRGVSITGTKTAHGLTYSAFRIINSAGVISADAEL